MRVPDYSTWERLVASLSWVSLPVERAGWWGASHRLGWPYPLDDSPLIDAELWRATQAQAAQGTGPGSDEVLAGLDGSEISILNSVAAVLSAPEQGVSAVRMRPDDDRSYYAGFTRDEVAAALVLEDGWVRFTEVPRTLVAMALASQLPLPVHPDGPKVELAGFDAWRFRERMGQDAGSTSLAQGLRAAGAPERYVAYLYDEPAAVGWVTAVRFAAGGQLEHSRSAATWMERGQDGLLSRQDRRGVLVYQPAAAATVAKAMSDALTALY